MFFFWFTCIISPPRFPQRTVFACRFSFESNPLTPHFMFAVVVINHARTARHHPHLTSPALTTTACPASSSSLSAAATTTKTRVVVRQQSPPTTDIRRTHRSQHRSPSPATSASSASTATELPPPSSRPEHRWRSGDDRPVSGCQSRDNDSLASVCGVHDHKLQLSSTHTYTEFTQSTAHHQTPSHPPLAFGRRAPAASSHQQQQHRSRFSPP